MKFEALVRVDVVVPFDHDAPVLDVQEHLGVEDGRTKILDVRAFEKARAKTEKARVAAARRANDEVVDEVRKALKGSGEVADAVVLEVREAAK